MILIGHAFRDANPRLRALGIGLAAGMVVLLAGMARIQVLHAGLWSDREQSQSLRRVRLPSVRGEMVDRHGEVLAQNRPSYDVVVYLDQLARISKRRDIMPVARDTLRELGRVMGLPVQLSEQQVRTHYAQRRVLPLTVWRDLTPQQVAMFAERAAHVPAVDLMVSPVRQYPHGVMASHVIGFVGRASTGRVEHEEDDGIFLYDQPDTVGRDGIERAYDAFLRGGPGARTVRVSPAGTTVEEVAVREATRGNRVVLTLDARLQRVVEDVLAQAPAGQHFGRNGSAVVVDPRNGELLAMASAPGFDPNIFNPGMPASLVRQVMDDHHNAPMVHRAINARYPPGSTFKPVSMLAALECGVASLQHDAPVTCAGGMHIGSWHRIFPCWKKDGHGSVDMMQAMRQSCDIWFYERGMATGAERIAAMAMEFGLGQRTGIDVPGESAGLVPTPSWKMERRGERWWDGDSAQLAIGQSFLVTTPLQMAMMTAALANGGTRWRPYVVKEIQSPHGETLQQAQPRKLGQLNVSRANLETVRRSLLAAVMDAAGTGQRAMVKGVKVAGKTGTAEFDFYEGDVRHRVNRVWFVGFAPYDAPTVAVAVVLEDGVSGGSTAAPLAGRILAACFHSDVERTSGGGGD